MLGCTQGLFLTLYSEITVGGLGELAGFWELISSLSFTKQTQYPLYYFFNPRFLIFKCNPRKQVLVFTIHFHLECFLKLYPSVLNIRQQQFSLIKKKKKKKITVRESLLIVCMQIKVSLILSSLQLPPFLFQISCFLYCIKLFHSLFISLTNLISPLFYQNSY